jgi:hypothetical protein
MKTRKSSRSSATQKAPGKAKSHALLHPLRRAGEAIRDIKDEFNHHDFSAEEKWIVGFSAAIGVAGTFAAWAGADTTVNAAGEAIKNPEPVATVCLDKDKAQASGMSRVKQGETSTMSFQNAQGKVVTATLSMPSCEEGKVQVNTFEEGALEAKKDFESKSSLEQYVQLHTQLDKAVWSWYPVGIVSLLFPFAMLGWEMKRNDTLRDKRDKALDLVGDDPLMREMFNRLLLNPEEFSAKEINETCDEIVAAAKARGMHLPKEALQAFVDCMNSDEFSAEAAKTHLANPSEETEQALDNAKIAVVDLLNRKMGGPERKPDDENDIAPHRVTAIHSDAEI